MSTIEERVTKLEVDMTEVKETLRIVALQQQANAAAIGQVEAQLSQLSNRVDTFVYESQRLFGRLGESAQRQDAAIESMIEAIGRLTRNAEADRSEMRASTLAVNSMVSRLDALVDYLMRDRRE